MAFQVANGQPWQSLYSTEWQGGQNGSRRWQRQQWGGFLKKPISNTDSRSRPSRFARAHDDLLLCALDFRKRRRGEGGGPRPRLGKQPSWADDHEMHTESHQACSTLLGGHHTHWQSYCSSSTGAWHADRKLRLVARRARP